MHLNSELMFKKYALPHFKDGIKVLEIGPAGIPTVYQKIVNNNSITWHTIDFSSTIYINALSNQLTFTIENPYIFPVKEIEYDIVLSGQVIEHVSKPWIWLRELKRITKNDGFIITINPVSWPYHEAPIDCWRIFPEGVAALADELDLEIQLNKFESLEPELLKLNNSNIEVIPGRSFIHAYDPKSLSKRILIYKIFNKLRLFEKYLSAPIEVAFDCISILKKNK